MFIITWNKDSKTMIHDHAENGCILKMLRGSLKETIYKDGDLIKSNYLINSDTGCINNDIGYHSIENISDGISVSLHIYSPCNHNTKYI
jgi:cysteine dioxygenase